MASNKYILADKNKMLKDKLDRLARKLEGSLETSEFATREEFLFEATKLLGEFYKDLTEPQMEVKDVRVDGLPDPSVYNELWQQLLDDLTIIFSELENIESLTVANFNYITTESNRLTARLKSVSSKLGDYTLYSLNPLKDAFFFKDSFNDLSKIDSQSALLNVDQCDINQTEGIVVLPVDKEKDSTVIVHEAPVINPNSNGVAGNNQELGTNHRGDLGALLDNNPDSWFEFEKVVTKIADDKDPLVLDLTINLGEETVINHIRINPNNFGTKTIININDIKTSIDGQVYTSIKDDIPIAGFVTQDEENIFQLAPSTSRFAGQGLYTFTPRKVKYIHFVFSQAEPYIITTGIGEKLRYAIGIRDIDIRSFVYKSAGELVSTPFKSQIEIRKVLLQSNQNPSELSELASIQWFVSPDDGATWYEIQPKEFGGVSGIVTTPEILEFNGVSADTINTAVPVGTVRVKMVLNRVDEQFVDGTSTLQKRVITKSELHSVPNGSPFSFDLEESPVDGTVVVVDPLFGSRGLPESPYILGHVTDRLDLRKYRLPFSNLPRPVKKVLSGGKYHVEQVEASEWQHLEVGGDEWSHATETLSGYANTDKVFLFNINTGEVVFGDSTNGGLAPAENEPIVTWFDAEGLFPSEVEDDHIAKLDFTTSANKNDMVIRRYDEIQEVIEVFPRKATIIRLKNKNLVDIENIKDKLLAAGYDHDPTTFLNGKDELVSNDNWSIDEIQATIFTRVPTPDDSDITASYSYQPIYQLANDEWDWTSTSLLRDAVSIKEIAWQTISVANEALLMEDDVNIIDLAHLAVVQGTLTFDLISGVDQVPDDETPFQKEVAFQDGVIELGGSVSQTKEQIPAHTGGGQETFDFTEIIATSTDFGLLFSRSVYFSSVQSWGNCSSPGDWAINRGLNQFQFYSTVAITDPGRVTYFYVNPNFSNNGLYSIDYKLGRIHTQIIMANEWALNVNYDHTDFRAEYKIARLLDPKNYDVDITNQSITIKDSEILKHLVIPHGRLDSRTPYYLVNYDYVAQTREDVEALRDYFSPIIKDYALKVLTKSRIF